jgi:ParB family transcriptional regulator, chromosome partitioning protein
METARLDIDLHRLELRYASARLSDPRAIDHLARSIDRCGQLIPCIVVADAERLVLIDGYRRIAALRRLGHDTARVEQWQCDLAQALLSVLARAKSRAFAALEEALLLRELVHGLHLSQHEVARRSGRDVSWVQRRLQLLLALPDPLLEAVRAGQLSTWAATRIFAPLARANADHADRLCAALATTPLTTRELHQWFEHYQRATRDQRERLITHPRLFLNALHEATAQRAIDRLRAGPEGECLADMRQVEVLIRRIKKRLPALAADTLPEDLANALAGLKATLEAFHHEIRRYCDHDPRADPHHRTHPASARPDLARDQPPAQALA